MHKGDNGPLQTILWGHTEQDRVQTGNVGDGKLQDDQGTNGIPAQLVALEECAC